MRLLPASALLVLLAGCGGGEGSAADPEPETEDYSALIDIADAAGCSDYTPQDEPMMFASESGDCDAGGTVGQITMNLFNNNEARDKYVDVGTSNGAVYVVGDGWLVECQNRAQQDAVAQAVGGAKRG